MFGGYILLYAQQVINAVSNGSIYFFVVSHILLEKYLEKHAG